MLGEHLKGKILNDKRAELLEDFRNMEAAGVNIDNLIRRHKKSMTDHSEHRFVDLLCKTIADPNDPTKGRQATLKWLNDMSNAKFDQMLYLLDHDVVIQWFQKGRQRAGKIIKQISDGLKANGRNLAQWLRSPPWRFLATGSSSRQKQRGSLRPLLPLGEQLEASHRRRRSDIAAGGDLRGTHRRPYPTQSVSLAGCRYWGLVDHNSVSQARSDVIGQKPLVYRADIVGRRVLPLEVRPGPQSHLYSSRRIHFDLFLWRKNHLLG